VPLKTRVQIKFAALLPHCVAMHKIDTMLVLSGIGS
jgi:hypothetical protein